MRYLLLITVLWGLSVVKAQDAPLLFETFTEPSRAWPLGDFPDYSTRPDSGTLHFEHRAPGTTCFVRELFMQEVVHLSIEGRLRLQPNALYNQSGICWSVSPDGKRYYAFQIRPEGEFRVVAVDGTKENVLVAWQKSRRIRPAGEYNTLRIVKEGRSLYGHINDKEVFRIPWQRFNGKYHGFCFKGNGEWELDYLRIEHPPVVIPLVPPPMLDAASFPLDSLLTDSSYNESAPRVSPDGRTIYFTRSEPDSALRSGAVYFTHFQGDTLWSRPQPLFPATSSQPRQEVFYIAPDHQSMWLSSTPAAASTGIYGISFRSRDSLWRTEVPGEIPELQHRGAPAGYHLSEDQSVLILSAQRSDSYGGRDLYVCFREGMGWSVPRHLGPDLNSWGEEISPYLMADNKTLFFASSGRPGYGQVDLYMSVRQSNTWTDWSEPLNLGPGINGPFWDTHYLPLKNPRRAYMAKQDSSGDFDLYTVRIPEDLTAKGVARVFGEVRNQKNGARLNGSVVFKAIGPDTLTVAFNTLSPAQGYQGLLPFGRAYSVHADVPGYFPQVDTLDLRPLNRFREVQQDLWVQPMEVGQIIQLKQVYFKRAMPELLPDSYAELDRLVLLMKALPGLEIEIQGHTDNIGKADELQVLSEARAHTVLLYLTTHGIAEYRIRSRGFGDTRPVASNENPATRHLNRRVEFEILSR